MFREIKPTRTLARGRDSLFLSDTKESVRSHQSCLRSLVISHDCLLRVMYNYLPSICSVTWDLSNQVLYLTYCNVMYVLIFSVLLLSRFHLLFFVRTNRNQKRREQPTVNGQDPLPRNSTLPHYDQFTLQQQNYHS